MALLVPDVGEVVMLSWMLKTALSVDEGQTLKLYKTNVTPAESDTAGSYTESDFTGYVAKSITRASWATPTTSSGTTSTTSTQLSWTPTSTQTCYGYFVVGATSGTLLWAELFSTSVSLFSGVTLNLTPRMQLD